MKTSYFAKAAKHKNAVCIAYKPPWFFKGRCYPKLAPKKWLVRKFKEDGDEAFYTEHYYRDILSKLNPKDVYRELGEDAILLCWEGPDKFCHRHLVARWLNSNLGKLIKSVTEL